MKFENKEEDDVFMGELSKKMKQFCCPVFLKKHAYDTTHSDETPNGTMMFIKFLNVVYGCTCKHVVDAAIKNGTNGKAGALHILADNILFQQNALFVNPEQPMDFISYPVFLIPNNGADIAIKPMSIDWFNQSLAAKKNLSYIDFDEYEKPDYEKVKMLHAFGWLNDHKYVENDKVITKLVDSYVDLNTTNLDKNTNEFQLFSEVKEPHNLSFSGMSGGPVVYCEDDLDKIILMGMIYQGQPGTLKPDEASFLNNPNNMLYKCLNLTPEKFADLLLDSDWIHKRDDRYKNFQALNRVRVRGV